MRPDPLEMRDPARIESLESAYQLAGVKARWLSVVDPRGNPYYASDHIPTILDDLEERERLLRDWVELIHSRGMAAVSWFPLSLCESGFQLRPEWRQHSLVEETYDPEHRDLWCCPQSGYGDALAAFCIEAIDRFGLDGFWFDGSVWTQIWHRPVPLTCTCESCRAAFLEQTGTPLPTAVDWSDPVFRRWVAWRYQTFGAYIGRLAAAIRAVHPHAVVVVNHYHRPRIPWQAAVPLDLYPADIITGSEAHGEALCDLTMRLCRAYGRGQSEVWMPLLFGDHPDTAPETDQVVHHALTCITAGGMPAYGTGLDPTRVPRTLAHISEVLEPVADAVGGEVLPYLALHVSAQTETFHYSRSPVGVDWELEPYWRSLMGWTEALAAQQLAPDFIYDQELRTGVGRRYSVLLMPLSVALSDGQAEAALRFAADGGTVVLGPGAGALDEWGEERGSGHLERELGVRWLTVPRADGGDLLFHGIRFDGGGSTSLWATACEVELTSDWELLAVREEDGQVRPAVARRPYGRGTVLAVALDVPYVRPDIHPAQGGATRLEVSDAVAAGGRHSLRFVDGMPSEQSFFPDLEVRFRRIGPPAAKHAELSFALRVDAASSVNVELRESTPRTGPMVRVEPGGVLWAGELQLTRLPLEEWVHVRVGMDLSPDGSCSVALEGRGGELGFWEGLPYREEGFQHPDWLVVYGPGTEECEFFVDDLAVRAVVAGGASADVLRLGFEDGLEPEVRQSELVAYVAGPHTEAMPPAVRVEAAPWLRSGVFQAGGKTLIHLHNLRGSKVGQGEPVAVSLRSRLPVKSARLMRSGRSLEPVLRDSESVLDVGAVPLHEVVVLELEPEP
jgi:hypothetical protein